MPDEALPNRTFLCSYCNWMVTMLPEQVNRTRLTDCLGGCMSVASATVAS